MSNSYFRFKQFTINQDKCAMKVGTDGCLLGGWFNTTGCKRILDIGCGSGLIALMAAQRCNAWITGIEIDNEAAVQATENVNNSPWKERIEVINCDAFEFTSADLFDTIVSNPPYFVNSLKCDDTSRTLARHSDSLDSNGFFNIADRLLTSTGRIAIIIPTDIFIEWQQSAESNGFKATRITYVKTTPRKAAKRVLAEFTRTDQSTQNIQEQTLILENSPGKYTCEAKEILRDFYLKITQ
ncbi:MAG: methyltransferase [Bacteroidaceae bacterium]|jgi:tRNA1Val (adenine37-N6)-methyltransferase|nr:methyltransferase [Bacteroidaceae bacterium]